MGSICDDKYRANRCRAHGSVVATVNEFARRDVEGRMAVVRIPPELSSDPRVRYDAAASRLILPISGLVGLLYRLGPPAPRSWSEGTTAGSCQP